MGVNFTQYAMIGWKFDVGNIKTEVVPPIYEDQARYDTRTGKPIASNRVLVKYGQYEYKLFDCTSDDPYYLCEEIRDKYNLDCECVNGTVYIGKFIGEREDYGRVELLEDEISVNSLADIVEDFTRYIEFVDESPSLIFFSQVG